MKNERQNIVAKMFQLYRPTDFSEEALYRGYPLDRPKEPLLRIAVTENILKDTCIELMSFGTFRGSKNLIQLKKKFLIFEKKFNNLEKNIDHLWLPFLAI